MPTIIPQNRREKPCRPVNSNVRLNKVRTMNILIADDNPIIQMFHGELMRCWGYDFDMASDGLEAVDLAKKNNGQYDFCLMDIDMPKMNGIEATKVIRSTVKYFPIMAFTSNDDYKKACYAVGMDDFAEKTCPPDDLFVKINELSVKLFKFIVKPNGFDVTEVMPMDQQHAQELRKLKSQGLVKLRLDGPDNREVIAHKNVPNKISHDFNILKYSMTEFLNRDPERPTLVDLYRGSKNCIIETFVDDESYQEQLETEDEKMNSYLTKHYKSDEE